MNTQINIDEFTEYIKKEKMKLKEAILLDTTTHISAFETKTGLNIKTIDFEFTHMQRIGESKGAYILIDVNIEVDLQI